MSAKLFPGFTRRKIRTSGATINLVAHHQAEDFMKSMARQYQARTGHKLEPMLCQIVDGAG